MRKTSFLFFTHFLRNFQFHRRDPSSLILNLSLLDCAMTTQPLSGFNNSLMNQKKPKDEEKIRNEQSELWKHIFINGYFQFAYRTNDEKYNVLQIYGKYCLYYRPYTA